MDNTNNKALELVKYFWDEYKYRHGMCWQALFKIFTAVIILGVLPYTTKPELSRSLGFIMMIPPVIGTCLAVFGYKVISNELRLFAQSKILFHELRTRLVSPLDLSEDAKNNQDVITSFKESKRTTFDKYVKLLVIALILASVTNTLFILFRWTS